MFTSPPTPQGPRYITKVNLLFKGVVCGVSKLSSSEIHLSEVALVRGLADTPLFIDIHSGFIVRHSFTCLHLWQVIGQSWQEEEGEEGMVGDGPPHFYRIHSPLPFLFKLSPYTHEHLKNTYV